MGFANAAAIFFVPQPGVCRKVTYIESLALFSFFSYIFFFLNFIVRGKL